MSFQHERSKQSGGIGQPAFLNVFMKSMISDVTYTHTERQWIIRRSA